MLYLENSIKLDSLFESFTKKIRRKEIWSNPFDSPLIIFSDSKIEQWFKLNSIKNRKSDSVLMNLNTAKLESFLFTSIAAGISKENVWYELLSGEILKDILINKLISEEDGKKYYKNLNSSIIDKYLENQDGTINELRLYNFANILSKLFIKYVDERNHDINNGIHKCWIEGNDFFDLKDEDKDLQNWQKQIYKDLLSEEELCIRSKDGENFTRYVTLAQLVEINKKSNNGELKFKTGKSKIFLFGFCSMGKFYRSLLSALSSSVDLYVYIHSSDVDYEKSENPLLKKWNQTCSDNFILWKAQNPDEIKTSEDSFYEGNTLLGQIQKQVSENICNPDIYSKYEKDGTFKVIGAPSRVKEIEMVHSSICSIIQNNENVSYSDFIVLAPDIQDYRVPVMQVFNQNEKNNPNGFPYIPYVFSDYSADYSATKEALSFFVSILRKDSLYRTDLFELLRNPVVCKARNFSVEEIDAWSDWVIELNGYRDRINSINEWKDLEKRLLISTLTENLIFDEKNGEIYKPYADMNTENAERLYKFIDAVDSLEDFRAVFANKTELSLEDINNISEFLTNWLKMPVEEDNSALSGERIVFSQIKNEIENTKLLFKFGYEKIKASSFFISLCDNAKSSKGGSSNLYTGGITFGNLSLNRAIPAKYVFIIGLDSISFPKVDSQQSLDLRLKLERETGDDTISARDKQAFLCQLMACGQMLTLSYVNSDLVKDAEHFRSSLIDDLLEVIGNKKSFEKSISLDETRSWDELYTQREFRNKVNFKQLIKNEVQEEEKEQSHKNNLPQRLSISTIKAFLKNPFIFYAKSLFSEVENDKEAETELYEPIKLSPLDRAIIVNEIVYKFLTGESKDFNKEIEDSLTSLKSIHSIPDSIFGDFEKEKLRKGITNLIKGLTTTDSFDINNFTFKSEVRTRIPLTIGEEDRSWELNGTLCPYYWDRDNKTLTVIDILHSADKKVKNHQKLSAYLSALSLVAGDKEIDEISIKVHLIHYVEEYDDKEKVEFSDEKITKESAVSILNDLYKNMYVKEEKKDIFKKFISIDKIPSGYDSFVKFLGDLENDNDWTSFSKAKLFDPYKDFGYEPFVKEDNSKEKKNEEKKVTFENQYAAAVAHIQTLFRIKLDAKKKSTK